MNIAVDIKSDYYDCKLLGPVQKLAVRKYAEQAAAGAQKKKNTISEQRYQPVLLHSAFAYDEV